MKYDSIRKTTSQTSTSPFACPTCATRGARPPISKSLMASARLFSAELTLAQARGNEYQSVVQLYKSLGGGWQE